MKPKGWRNESRRHSLASKGIKTAQNIKEERLRFTNMNKADIDKVFQTWFDEILERDMEWFRRIRKRYVEIRDDYPPLKNEYMGSKERREAYKKAQNFLYNYPKFIYEAVQTFKGEKIAEKGFRKDMERRKENLIFKIEKKVGKIKDVSIRRNPNGGFDGKVKGDKGSAVVETIGAGGHNIQRFHYRTLVK